MGGQRTTMPVGHESTRYYVLDVLRLVAALAVLAYHYLGYHHRLWGAPTGEQFPGLAPLAAYGALGVELFFLISGFVILLSADGRTIGQFVASRISRLYPAYWFAVITTTVLIVTSRSPIFEPVGLTQFVANLTMFQTPLNVTDIDGVYWTLWVELLFYVLVGMGLCIGFTERRIMAFIVLWPTLGALAMDTNSDLLAALLSPIHAPMFAGGMALYLLYKNGHSLLRWLLVSFSLCLALRQVIGNFVFGVMDKVTRQPMSTAVAAALLVGCFALVALVTVGPLRHRGGRWMSYAGALTYPVYLIHETWGWWAISVFGPHHNRWLVLAGTVAGVLLFAAAIERWVERPMRSPLRRSIDRTLQ